MKRARIGIIATAVLAVATMAFAQAKPDFSGTLGAGSRSGGGTRRRPAAAAADAAWAAGR